MAASPTSESSNTVPKIVAPEKVKETLSGRIGTAVDSQAGLDEDEPEEEKVDHTGSRFVLTDNYRIKHVWTFIVMVLLGYTATIFLYRFAFIEFRVGGPLQEHRGWFYFDWTVDILFMLDLLVNFFLSYKDDKGNEVDSLKLIALKYMRFNFWINLAACIPEDAYKPLLNAMASQNDDGTGLKVNNIVRITRLQRISRLARLGRVTRLAKIHQILSRSTFWQWFQHLRGVRIVNFICCLFWVVHLLACGWYITASLHEDENDTWVIRRDIAEHSPAEQWTCAMYWVLMVFTTVGFGDIIAVTVPEMIYCAVTMVVGAVIHSIVISEVIGIVQQGNAVSIFIGKQLHLVEAFSAHAKLDAKTSQIMKTEITWRAKHSAIHPTFDKAEMKALLTGRYMPRWLVSGIPQRLFGGKLLKNKFLPQKDVHKVPPRLPALLAMHLLSMDFLAGDIIYQQHDFPFNLFVVLCGTFAYIGQPTPKGGRDAVDDQSSAENGALTAPQGQRPNSGLFPYRLFSGKSYFGDSELIKTHARRSTCRCERNGTALTLHKKDYLELTDMFPDIAVTWRFAGIRREAMRKHSLKQLTRGQKFKEFAAVQIQRYFRDKRNKSGASSTVQRRSLWGSTTEEALHQQKREGGDPLQAQVSILQRDLDNFKKEIKKEIRDELRSFRDEVRLIMQGSSQI